MSTISFAATLRRLPPIDRALLVVLVACALFALAIGVIFGASTGLVRAGLLDADPERGYRLMTAHGVTIFFYWLYFGQAALLLAFAAAYGRPVPRLALAPAAWLGLALMLAGLAASQLGTWLGAPLLYDGSPELVGADDRVMAGVFYLGYLLLGAGLVLLATAAIATALAGKAEDGGRAWSAITFGTVAWAGLVMVSAVATLNVFLPAALWAFGLGGQPADHTTGWHLLFHNLHYLPLMGTVLAWYVLIREMTGVGSILGERFSKAVFTLYLVVVPPTSLYHMFLEPGLAPSVLALGSLLSLFIGVPTIAMFLVIVASLEVQARTQGARGLFGWLRFLPWREPAMAALGMAVVNLALGGTLAFVLIQEQLASLLSDTFFVPGYFHFLTIGTVTLTLLAALTRLVPGLTGRALWTPRLLSALPYVVTAGLLLFGVAGVAAGLTGMPRRMLDVSLAGAAPAAWLTFSRLIGSGGLIMAAGLLLYAAALGGALVVGRRPAEGAIAAPPALMVPGRHTEHGVALTLHVARAGEAFAEASLFSRTYHCDGAADVSSLVRAYPKRALLRALREDSEAALALTGHLARQVQALRGHIELLNIKSARDRVLGYLHNHLSASAKHVELERTWKAIATEIGLTHEAVYRALAALEREGLIERDENAVVLRQL